MRTRKMQWRWRLRLRRIATPSLVERTLAITMRTPGADDELTAGYLFSEGVIQRGTGLQRA